MPIYSYDFSPLAEAFSTTRRSPRALSPQEEEEMGAYAAFNVTDYTGDAPERVAAARRYLCEKLAIAERDLWMPRQTHTATVRVVDETACALEEDARRTFLNETDALVTHLPGVCVGVSTADCVPVLLVDEGRRVVAAVHAGWRGTVGKIVQRTIAVMTERYGTKPAELKVLLGPSISVEAYEVGEELVERFAEAGFSDAIVRRPSAALGGNGRPHLDLWAANVELLEAAGVPFERIMVSGVCTHRHADTFFSARRLGIKSGRTFTGIMLKPNFRN